MSAFCYTTRMIPYFETHITEACNLKCRGCSHFSVFAKPKHKDIGEFEKEFKRLSEIEQVGMIRLMGGEPLLNPNFMEYCRIARKYFPRSIIAIVTNGILGDRLTPHEAELRSLHINVIISEYHLENQKREKADTLHEKGSMYNISLDPTGSQDGDLMYFFCDHRMSNCFYLADGRMYLCAIAGCIHDFWNHFGLDWGIKQEELGIDIFKHTAEEIESFLHKPCELCRFCDTLRRPKTYQPFSISKGDISEWTNV